MNNLPRQMLRQILTKHGADVCGDAKRCENLLNDACGSYRREINVLVNAIEERVPLDLLAGAKSMPLELLLTRLEKRLEEQTALTADAARWAVESWALALNLTTESEIQKRRERIESAALPISKTQMVQPKDSANGSNFPKVAPHNPIQPPKPTTTAAPQPRTHPPIIRQPTPMPKPAPPIVFPRNNPPARQPSVQPPMTNQTVATRRSFGIFRGCLFVIFLLAAVSVVLFLGVPYAIEVMRETQRERNNEPPRFPVR